MARRIPKASPFASVAAALSAPPPRSPFAAAATALVEVPAPTRAPTPSAPRALGDSGDALERRFRERFGTLFPDAHRVLRRLVDDVAPKVGADTAYRNAQRNTPHNARIEYDHALRRVMLGLLGSDIEVYKQWADNPPFKRFVADLVFELTNAQPRASAAPSSASAATPAPVTPAPPVAEPATVARVNSVVPHWSAPQHPDPALPHWTVDVRFGHRRDRPFQDPMTRAEAEEHAAAWTLPLPHRFETSDERRWASAQLYFNGTGMRDRDGGPFVRVVDLHPDRDLHAKYAVEFITGGERFQPFTKAMPLEEARRAAIDLLFEPARWPTRAASAPVSERRPVRSREAAAQAREVAEMEQLLVAAGYDPAHAARLRAEGMGPFELEDRLKHKPGSVGSLPYTHGIEPRQKPPSTRPERSAPPSPREVIAPESAAADTGAALQASRDVALASTSAERGARHRTAAAVHRAAAQKTSDEARAAHDAAAIAHDAVAVAEAAHERAASARNLETTKAGRERMARRLAEHIAQAAKALAEAKAALDVAVQRVERPGEPAPGPSVAASPTSPASPPLAPPSPPTGPVSVPQGGRPVLFADSLVAEELHGCTVSFTWEGQTLRGVVDSYTLRTPEDQALRVYFEGGKPWPVEPEPTAVTVLALPLTNTTFPGAATLYYQGDSGMAYRKIEVRDVELFFRPYAQYSAAVRVTFTPRGARTQREMWLTYKPTLVILAGHGHPAPDDMWTEPKSAGPGVATQMSRHMAFSEEWTNEAREMIATYAARTGTRVLADLHGYNPHRKLTEAELAAWDAVRGDERREAY
jgi:hypothetical protein